MPVGISLTCSGVFVMLYDSLSSNRATALAGIYREPTLGCRTDIRQPSCVEKRGLRAGRVRRQPTPVLRKAGLVDLGPLVNVGGVELKGRSEQDEDVAAFTRL